MKLNTIIIIISILINYTAAFAADDPFVNVKRILFVGNSITCHKPRPKLKWYGNYGMAATEKSKDYVHLILSALDKLYPNEKHEGSIFRIKNEGAMTGYEYLLKEKADLIIILLSENFRGKYNDEELRKPYEQMLKAFKKNITSNIICVGAWGYNLEQVKLCCKMMERAAQNQNIPFVFIGDLGCKKNAAFTDPNFRDCPKAIKWHPSDIGMRLIAERILELSAKNKHEISAAMTPKKTMTNATNDDRQPSDLKFPGIFPTPREIRLSTDSFSCPAKVNIFEQNGNSIASQELSRILMDKWDVVSNMYSDSSNTTPTFKFVLDNSSDMPESNQGYILEIGRNNIIVKARAKQGLFYGMQTLSEMIKSSSFDRMLKACVIRDWPACKMRGCYLSLKSIKVSENAMAALKRLIDMFAALKLNTLVIEIAGNMHYEREKFIKKSPFSKKQAAELAAYAKNRYFEVIPYLQTLSHTRWICSHPGYKKLLEVPDDFSWTTAMCPSNPRANKFIENIIEENIEVFKPNYFHLGLDEIYMGPFRECPECRKKKPSALLLSHIKKTTAILKKHKVTPIIYHDSLLPGTPVPGNKIPVNKGIVYDKVHGWKIINELDKNTVINIWDYSAKPDRSFLDYFSKKGFPILAAASCSDIINAQEFPRLLENFSNSSGIIMTYWFHAKGWIDPLKNLSREALAATLFMAQYSWNTNAGDIQNTKYDPIYEMRKRIKPDYRRNPASLKYFPINLNRFFNTSIGNIPNWPNLNGNPGIIEEWNKSLGTLPEKFKLNQTSPTSFSAIALSGRNGDGLALYPVTIPMNIKADTLIMLHTTSPPNTKKYEMPEHIRDTPKIGKYVVNYMDGSKVEVPLIYRYNIVDWNSFLSGKNSRIALHAHDAVGNIVSFVKSEWQNPFPGKVIRDIVFSSSMTDGIAPALLGLTACRQKYGSKQLINIRKSSLPDIKKLITVNGSNKKSIPVSVFKSLRDSNVLQIIIPPAKETLCLRLDIPIKEDLSSLKQINLSMQINVPSAILNSGIYLGKNISYSPCWMKFRLIDTKSAKWQKIDIPISEMKKNPGFNMSQCRYIRLSIWIRSPKQMIIYLKSPKWSSDEDKTVILRKKLTD